MLLNHSSRLVPPRAIVPQAVIHRILPDTKIERIAGGSNTAVEDELAQARMTWRAYRSSRERDAVYQYLTAVFKIVRRWKKQRRVNAGSLQALAATRHPGVIRISEPCAVVIFTTSDPSVLNAKTRSKWARALQFAEQVKPNAQSLAQFIKSQGGINECADECHK